MVINLILPVFFLDADSDSTSGKNKTGWRPLTALKKRIAAIGTAHIVFGTDWPLIDIDPYIELLRKNLGNQTTQQILNMQVPAN